VIITLIGTNSFALKHELDQKVAAFLQAHDAMGLERVDGEEAEYDRLAEAITSLPFLADKKLVVVRNGAANKVFAEKIKDLLPQVPETTDVVLVEPKLDKRSAYYKLLKKDTEYQEFGDLDAGGLARWLSEQATQRGGSLSSGDARFLVDRVGPNQQLLAHELDKLLLHNPQITHQTIELLTEAAPQSTIFELLEAAFAGNTTRTMALYQEQRALKVEPQQIIAMLAWQLHILLLVKTGAGRPADQVAKDAKLNPFVVRKSSAIAAKRTLPQLRILVRQLLTIDTRLKRESIDADEAVQNYLLKIAAGS